MSRNTRISSGHLLRGVVLFSFVCVVVMYFITTLIRQQPRHRVNTNRPAISVRSYLVTSHPAEKSPVTSQSVTLHPLEAYHVKRNYVISYPVKTNSLTSFPVKKNHGMSYPVQKTSLTSFSVNQNHKMSYPVQTNPLTSYSVQTNPLTSYPVQTNPLTSYPVTLRVLYYNKPKWVSGEEFNNCEYRCKMISGSKAISSVKFVIFHGPRIHQRLPPNKSRGQIWILNGLESPVNYHTDLSNWTYVFNWTFTFRRDSDVLLFNFRFQNIPENKTASDDWKRKDRQAAWMVSNCRTYSRREQYVKQLQKFTAVHIYGKCGTHNCSRSKENSCMEILQNRYQYYLAYENSLCMDYVSEKGFKTYAYSPSTIPIMRGGSNYSLYFPPRSYINTKDFESAKTLGKTMHSKLMAEGKLETYFSWTQSYSIDRTMPHDSWCTLCKRMHHAENHKRLYSNIKHWLFDNPRQGCKSPTDL